MAKTTATSSPTRQMQDPAVRIVASAEVAVAVSGTLFASAAANQYWQWDRRWHAAGGVWVDATMCASRHGALTPASELAAGACTDAFCEWGFWKAAIPCSAQAFADVMFQSQRYTWCQTQLANLVLNRPRGAGGTIEQRATLAAQWCLDVMRLVSMARYATNIASDYLPRWAPWTSPDRKDHLEDTSSAGYLSQTEELGESLSPDTQAAYDEIFSYLPPGVADSPSFHHMLSVFQPKDFNDTSRDPRQPPTDRAHFDPVISTLVQSVTRARGGGYPPEVIVDSQKAKMGSPEGASTAVITVYPWPGTNREHMHFGSLAVFEVMVTWFKATLGTGYWFKKSCFAEHTHYRRQPINIGEEPTRVTTDRIDIWYGGADALMRLCEAWAIDVAGTSFGAHVASGLQRYLSYMEAVPADKRLTSMTTGEISAIAGAINQRVVDEAAAAIGTVAAVGGAIAGVVATVPVVGWIAGLIVGLGTLLATAFTALHIETRAMGTALPGMVCPPSPFVRMLPDDGTNACNFDHRTFVDEAGVADGGIRAEDRVVEQAGTVAAAAEAGLPPEAWHAASEYGAGETTLDELYPLGTDEGGPPEEQSVSWTPYLIVGGLLLGGAAILKITSKG